MINPAGPPATDEQRRPDPVSPDLDGADLAGFLLGWDHARAQG